MPLIATFNVNSVRTRLDQLTSWLKERKPDIVCLQELKCQDGDFPRGPIEDLGYNVETHGQKSYNGVAILSKYRFDEVIRRLPGDEADEQSRYIEGVFSVEGKALRVASLYLPNGNPAGTEKYSYKLAWMERLRRHAEERLTLEEPFVLAGDYNVIPQAEDAKNPKDWLTDALFLPETRAAFRRLISLGYTEATRAMDSRPGLYSFWDYQAGAYQRDNGIRIDHLLLSPQAADLLRGGGIDKAQRGEEKPSDHVPVWISLTL
jgi:exodeoxyribonuclease-3